MNQRDSHNAAMLRELRAAVQALLALEAYVTTLEQECMGLAGPAAALETTVAELHGAATRLRGHMATTTDGEDPARDADTLGALGYARDVRGYVDSLRALCSAFRAQLNGPLREASVAQLQLEPIPPGTEVS